MDKNYGQIPLPHDYNENAMHLLVQSPRVLYAYWELSPGLKNVFSEKKGVQIRLNAQGRGPYCTGSRPVQRSHYFSGVEPGRSYNCEIGIVKNGNEFYPLLRSNSVVAPLNGLRKNTARARTLIPFPLQPSAQAPGLPGQKITGFGPVILLRALFGPCGLGHINYVRDQCQLNDSRKIFKHKWENFNMMVMCGCKSPYSR